MKQNTFVKSALFCVISISLTGVAIAELTVDKSQGQLNISSDINGTVIAKVIDPDDVMVVDERYFGNSFSWSPSSGPDGAYRYDVRVIPTSNADTTKNQEQQSESTNSDYAGGSVEVINGQIGNSEESAQ